MASVCSHRKSGFTTVVPAIQFSTTLDEQGADAGVSFQRSNHQQRPRILIHHIWAESILQLLSETDDVALLYEFAGFVESHAFRACFADRLSGLGIRVLAGRSR